VSSRLLQCASTQRAKRKIDRGRSKDWLAQIGFPLSCGLAKEPQKRWRDEASFFDKFVGEVEVAHIDPLTLAPNQESPGRLI